MLKRILLLTILTGSVVGIAGTGFAPARAQPATAPRAYYVAEFELRDPEGIRPYSAGVAATFEPFGGRFIVRGGRIAALEGPPPDRGPWSSSSQAWSGHRPGTTRTPTGL